VTQKATPSGGAGHPDPMRQGNSGGWKDGIIVAVTTLNPSGALGRCARRSGSPAATSSKVERAYWISLEDPAPTVLGGCRLFAPTG